MAIVELRGIERRFGSVRALDGVDLRVDDGELCVVVGPSGCGKSTLLRAVAGLEPLDAGGVWIDGRDVTRAEPRDRDVAFVFQSYALYPHLTVRENLEFPLRVRKVARDERQGRVREAAELLRIDDLLDRRPAELSGGQRQRVAMGRAVVRRPKVFLFDEPLSNLDARLRGRMRVELIELHRRLGATSLYVTHDQAEAMTLGQQLVVLRDGRVHQIGSPREIYERPVDPFVAGFIGSPPMNFIEGKVRVKEGERQLEWSGLPLAAPGFVPEGPAVLGIRAEDLLPGSGRLSLRVRLVDGPRALVRERSARRRRVASVAARAIDPVYERLTPFEVPEVFGEDRDDALDVVIDQTGHVGRNEEVRDVPEEALAREWLLFEHVHCGPRDPFLLERIGQRSLVDDSASRQVDEKRARLHACDPVAVEEPARFGREGKEHDDGIGLGEDFVGLGWRIDPIRVRARLARTAGSDDAHAERPSALCNRLAY
jgi:ABC-type sugar transport system ATPase subunit